MKILRLSCVVGGFLSVVLSLPAQTLNTLYSFSVGDEANPVAGLVQGTDGNFYGTTSTVHGTVFKITTSGTLTTLHTFTGGDGSGPLAALVQGTDGNLYGTTHSGGANNGGTVFNISTSGTLATLYNFCSEGGCADGSDSVAALIQATDGDFYGTTSSGGANNGGTVFKISTSGTLTTLHSFCSLGGSECTDGASPVAALLQATDGNFYGTTSSGGANNAGTVFEITPSGALTTLYSFCSLGGSECTDGMNPVAALLQATDGNFYGTTSSGGAGGQYSRDAQGTVFSITQDGTLTTLHTFCSERHCSDGAGPRAGLIQATDGNFYGTTAYGSVRHNDGTLFKITSGGTLTTLYDFCSQSSCTDGANPVAGLVQGTDGNFYGTTEWGGGLHCVLPNTHAFTRCGTVFSFSESSAATRALIEGIEEKNP